MPYAISYYDQLHPQLVAEMHGRFTDPEEWELLQQVGEYNLHVLLLKRSTVYGWAALRTTPSRLMADITVVNGRGSIERMDLLLEGVRALAAERPITIEWWTRATSARPAATVARRQGLPMHRKILRLERDLPPLEQTMRWPDIQLRGFRDDDAEEVVALNNLAFADHADRFDFTAEKLFALVDTREKARDLLLTHREGRLAGFIWTRPIPKDLRGELYVLAVHPEFQGLGLGGQLLEAGCAHLQIEHRVRLAHLYVDASDKFAVAMYKRHEFFDAKRPLVSYLA